MGKKTMLLEQDMFGHTLRLNFNKKGDDHATVYTSIMSLIIRAAIGFYVVIMVMKLVLKTGDDNFSSVNPVRLQDIGPIDYMESGLKIFHVIEKQGGRPEEGQSLQLGNRNLTQFLKIEYQFQRSSGGLIRQRIGIPAKECTAEDLDLSKEEAAELFDVWVNSTLVCPAFDDIGKIEIKGDTSSVETQSLVLNIERCTGRPGACALPQDIDNFIKDFEVSTWVVNQKMDFHSRAEKPISKQ